MEYVGHTLNAYGLHFKRSKLDSILDWEAPTGGYLLTACFASGVVAGRAAADYLAAAR